jgi:putative hydrolase of the HAD superfamily
MEKAADTYDRMIEQFKIVKSHGWMIGNSPRSDINPAVQSGLNAVFIPHHATWELEKMELESGAGRLLILSTFRDLRTHF